LQWQLNCEEFQRILPVKFIPALVAGNIRISTVGGKYFQVLTIEVTQAQALAFKRQVGGSSGLASFCL